MHFFSFVTRQSGYIPSQEKFRHVSLIAGGMGVHRLLLERKGSLLNSKVPKWCGTIPSEDALRRASLVRLILMDVDGVQTDGLVYYVHHSSGSIFETKGFGSHDGLAFHLLRHADIKYGAISGRMSVAVEERASNMGFAYLYQGNLDKIPALEEILQKSKFETKNIAYIGDDFTDVPIMKRVGLACAVADAREEAKSCAHFLTATAGGRGAVREVAELVLKAQNKWEEILLRYEITQTS
jgi:3-deoxy-D-manno-octulosonate 8-phosphate phosphatase (KDO 8-P phosphatase)